MARLKKLYLNKKYLVKMKKDDFLKNNHSDIADVVVNEEEVIFKSNLKYENSINRYKYFFSKIFKNYFLIFFSFIGTFLLFFVSNLYIREIKFENELFYSEQIYNDVLKEFKKVGNIYLVNESINKINSKLSEKYYNYAYIGIVRNVGKIYIVIKPLPEYEKVEEYGDEKGNLISKYNAYIVGIKLKKGVCLITINQMVKKGDLLITGNLKHHLALNNIIDYIHPIGSVFGKVVDEVIIKVPKVEKTLMLTGEVKKYFQISLFNKQLLSKKNYYETFEEVEKSVFKIGNFINFKSIFQYNKEEIIVEHNKESSYKFACSEIERKFFEIKVDDCEKIINYELIDCKEEQDYYCYVFRVKMIINIAEFIKIEY